MGGIFNYVQPVLVGDAMQGLQVARLACDVYRHERAGVRRHLPLNVFDIDVETSGDAIAKYRACAEVSHHLCAGGKGIGLIFKKGEVIRKVPEAQIVDALMEEVKSLALEKEVEKTAASVG